MDAAKTTSVIFIFFLREVEARKLANRSLALANQRGVRSYTKYATQVSAVWYSCARHPRCARFRRRRSGRLARVHPPSARRRERSRVDLPPHPRAGARVRREGTA